MAPCAPPDPAPRRPSFAVPPGACDCHIHIVEDPAVLPLWPVRRYTPHVATLAEYRRTMAALGLARAVIVQPSFYGTDNRATLGPLAVSPRDFRAVVVVDSATPVGTLDDLHVAGARGVRLNLHLPGGVGLADAEALAPTLRRLGWHVQVFAPLAEIVRLRDGLLALGLPLVIDHMAVPPVGDGPKGRDFRVLVDMLRSGSCWVKLSGSYRFTRLARPPYTDVVPFAQALVAADPERLVWGSDWPHTDQRGHMPNDGDLLDELAVWAPDPDIRRRILVDNPARLYGFG